MKKLHEMTCDWYRFHCQQRILVAHDAKQAEMGVCRPFMTLQSEYRTSIMNLSLTANTSQYKRKMCTTGKHYWKKPGSLAGLTLSVFINSNWHAPGRGHNDMASALFKNTLSLQQIAKVVNLTHGFSILCRSWTYSYGKLDEEDKNTVFMQSTVSILFSCIQ